MRMYYTVNLDRMASACFLSIPAHAIHRLVETWRMGGSNTDSLDEFTKARGNDSLD